MYPLIGLLRRILFEFFWRIFVLRSASFFSAAARRIELSVVCRQKKKKKKAGAIRGRGCRMLDHAWLPLSFFCRSVFCLLRLRTSVSSLHWPYRNFPSIKIFPKTATNCTRLLWVWSKIGRLLYLSIFFFFKRVLNDRRIGEDRIRVWVACGTHRSPFVWHSSAISGSLSCRSSFVLSSGFFHFFVANCATVARAIGSLDRKRNEKRNASDLI